MLQMSQHMKLTIKSSLSVIKRKIKRKLSFLISKSKLHKLDKAEVPHDLKEIRLFSMMRNESLRLPYFMNYYFSIGVDRIFLIDNGSTDESVSIALAKKNVHVFQTNESFTNFSNWLEILLDKYGKHRWCVAVDLDEIFFYPDAENKSIRELSVALDKEDDTAVRCFFLDMYSDKSITKNIYKQSSNPFLVCPYFDTEFDASETYWTNQRTLKKYKILRFSGNMRKRIFNISANLTKIPFFKYKPGIFLARGAHAIDGARISKTQGVVFHFKFFQDFNIRVIQEAKRGQHERGAAVYKKYARILNKEEDLNFYCERSVKFKNSQQLIDLNLMKKD